MILAEIFQPLGLVADAASKLNDLVGDTITAARVTLSTYSRRPLQHCLAKLFELAFREGILVADLFADLAFDPIYKPVGHHMGWDIRH